MTQRWNINKKLGPKGQSILGKEEKQFGEKTILKRKLLINKLFNLLSKEKSPISKLETELLKFI